MGKSIQTGFCFLILILYSTLQETMSRADEELQGAEDKLNHLSMVKSKLEQTLDDLEDTLDREKRSKADAEKTMRKMETDMKVHTTIISLAQNVKYEKFIPEVSMCCMFFSFFRNFSYLSTRP